MNNSLGQWALIDIETTGLNVHEDQIIDIGWLQFDGLTKVNEFSSLVRYTGELSFFIKKLTGIQENQLRQAPPWREVEAHLSELSAHTLVAHNAQFEESFLAPFFKSSPIPSSDQSSSEQYVDTLLLLAILFPGRTSLNLESFITDFGIAEKEQHRGFQDSMDLLKVMIAAVSLIKKDLVWSKKLASLLFAHALSDEWMFRFFSLSLEELKYLADQIHFDSEAAVLFYQKKQEDLQNSQKVIKGLSSEDSELKPLDLTFSGENISQLFKQEKRLQKKYPDYHYRQSQEELALKVGQSFKHGIHSLIQAPTGTGKTLGYLVPAALYSLATGQQVLIATGTKTLQSQAVEKDYPLLKKFLQLDDKKIQATRFLGSKNHLCELQFRKRVEENGNNIFEQEFLEKFSRCYFDIIFEWNDLNRKKMLIRDDIPFIIKNKVPALAQEDQEIAVDYRHCIGSRCAYKRRCSYLDGLSKAKESNLIFGNHALMFNWPKGFPRPAHIIVDEAHRLEHEATQAYSLTISDKNLGLLQQSLFQGNALGSLYFLMTNHSENATDNIAILRTEIIKLSEMMKDHLQALPELVERLFKRRNNYTELYWNEIPMIKENESKDELSTIILNHFLSLKFILSEVTQLLTPYFLRFDEQALSDDNDLLAFTRFKSLFDQVDDMRLSFEAIMKGSSKNSEQSGNPQNYQGESDSHEWYETFKFSAKEGFEICSSPIDIGKVLHQQLLMGTSSAIFTSATLGNANGMAGTKGVEWATGYQYLGPTKRFKSGLFLEPLYDYKNKAKIFLCDDTVSMHSHQYVSSVFMEISKLISDIHGGALLLFSSRVRFEQAREILIKEFEGKMPLFIQGMGHNIVEEFKKVENGILLGMESFGEGIDVPGQQLRFIFIDKIPDLRSELVIQERRNFFQKKFGNEFVDYYLSHRSRALHQKLGRLLRSESDTGAVIICDARIKSWKQKTKEQFFELMNPYQIQNNTLKESCEHVRDFFKTEPK